MNRPPSYIVLGMPHFYKLMHIIVEELATTPHTTLYKLIHSAYIQNYTLVYKNTEDEYQDKLSVTEHILSESFRVRSTVKSSNLAVSDVKYDC